MFTPTLTPVVARELQAHGLTGVHLLNRHFSRFTVGRLFDFLKRPGRKVIIETSPHRKANRSGLLPLRHNQEDQE